MPEKILVVAAHFPWLNSVGKVLIGERFEVLVAMTAQEAMDLAVRQVPDLIVIDPQLPDMDGLELCQQLRTHPVTARVPVIIVTRRNEIRDRLAAFMAGADDCLSSPIDLRELVARMRAILRRTTRRPPEGRGRTGSGLAEAGPETVRHMPPTLLAGLSSD